MQQLAHFDLLKEAGTLAALLIWLPGQHCCLSQFLVEQTRNDPRSLLMCASCPSICASP